MVTTTERILERPRATDDRDGRTRTRTEEDSCRTEIGRYARPDPGRSRETARARVIAMVGCSAGRVGQGVGATLAVVQRRRRIAGRRARDTARRPAARSSAFARAARARRERHLLASLLDRRDRRFGQLRPWQSADQYQLPSVKKYCHHQNSIDKKLSNRLK